MIFFLAIEDDIKQVNYDLEHIVDYAIAHIFERILKKYGQNREKKKTEIREILTQGSSCGRGK